MVLFGIRHVLSSALCCSLVAEALLIRNPFNAIPSITTLRSDDPSKASNVPLIIWHGLGDAFDADGLQSVGKLYQSMYPHSTVIFISQGPDGNADRQATFFGNLTEQVAATCDTLAEHDALKYAPAFNALGFSQGGQFLRGMIERCGERLPTPRALVTFGSQHNGIAQFAACGDGDWWCRTWSGVLRSNTWSDFVQSRLVPAQYFRDPEDLQAYLDHSNFLADINNERKKKQESYKKNLIKLGTFVMLMFEDDEVVKPKESSWFAEVNATTNEIIKLEDREIYKQDWIGLKILAMRGGLVRETTPGEHMKIEDGVLEDTFKKWFKPRKSVLDHIHQVESQLHLGWRSQDL